MVKARDLAQQRRAGSLTDDDRGMTVLVRNWDENTDGTETEYLMAQGRWSIEGVLFGVRHESDMIPMQDLGSPDEDFVPGRSWTHLHIGPWSGDVPPEVPVWVRERDA